MLQEPQETVDTPKKGVGSYLLNFLKYAGFIFLASVPMQLISILLIVQYQLSITLNSILGIITLALIIGIIMFLWNRYYKYSGERIKKVGWRDIGIALLFFLSARAIVIVSMVLIQEIYGEELTANDESLMSFTNDNTIFPYFALFVLAVGILVPVAEELVYRGIGRYLSSPKKAFWLPFILTSAIFGLVHGPTNIIAFLMYALMGGTFFLAYYRRKNIVDSMLVHIFNNMIAAITFVFSYMT